MVELPDVRERAMELKWIRCLLLAIPLQIAARILAPFALRSGDPTRAADWAWWIAPADHRIAGPKADPMWIRWWETDEGSRAWYCALGRKLGVRSTLHWFPRLMQLMRNAGAGGMYVWLGVRVDNCLIVASSGPNNPDLPPYGTKERRAYYLADTKGIGGGREPLPNAKPVAFYRQTYLPVGGRLIEILWGWKLNYAVEVRNRALCKLVASVRVKRAK